MLKSLMLNPTGGLTYHLRAAWHRKRWQPFCDYVARWLEEWRRDPSLAGISTLVLIGPNAGYTLSRSFISSFTRVVVVEPDPVAYALFEARFQCRALWIRRDYFDLKAKNPDPKTLRELFVAHPNAAFLFCNVLGQIPVLLRENKNANVETYMKELGKVFAEQKSVAMASYHDRYSRNLKKPNEYIDHLTGELFATAANKKEFPWRLTSREEHQIEFVRS